MPRHHGRRGHVHVHHTHHRPAGGFLAGAIVGGAIGRAVSRPTRTVVHTTPAVVHTTPVHVVHTPQVQPQPVCVGAGANPFTDGNIIRLTSQASGRNLRIHSNGFVDGKGGNGVWARFTVRRSSNGYVRLQNVGNPQNWLRITQAVMLNGQGKGGSWCEFIVLSHGGNRYSLKSAFSQGHVGILPCGDIKRPTETGTGPHGTFNVTVAQQQAVACQPQAVACQPQVTTQLSDLERQRAELAAQQAALRQQQAQLTMQQQHMSMQQQQMAMNMQQQQLNMSTNMNANVGMNGNMNSMQPGMGMGGMGGTGM